jgi:hypothetical protein
MQRRLDASAGKKTGLLYSSRGYVQRSIDLVKWLSQKKKKKWTDEKRRSKKKVRWARCD